MQRQSLVLIGLTLTVGSLAHAAAPVSPALMGEMKGIFSYCESIDRRDEDKLEKLDRSFSKGLSRHDLESMERDQNYRANFSVMQSVFRGMSPDDALQLCRNAVK
jgi:hypothetical protein